MIEYKNAENNIRHPNKIQKFLGENLIVRSYIFNNYNPIDVISTCDLHVIIHAYMS